MATEEEIGERGRRPRRRPLLVALLALSAAAATLAACDSSVSSSAQPPPSPSTPPTSATTAPAQLPPQTLTFGVFGGPDEVEAYQQMAALFAPLNRQVTVRLKEWPSAGAMVQDFESRPDDVPDVFLATRRYLLNLTQQQDIQPIDQLLDERGVDFGDSYPRSTLTAFAVDNTLTCLPYGIEPTVMLYNTRLVKLGKIPDDPATPGQGWNFDQAAAAARWTVQHKPRAAAGMYLDPTIGGLSPFVYSGGGQLFDDEAQPTSTAFGADPNRQTLTRITRALRRPHMTLSNAQLAQKTPLEWFEEGKLGMLEGNRHMVPRLRQQASLDFDVMPMPRIARSATTGTLTGLCISGSPRDVGTAADFLVYASSPDALGMVASAGYLQPANQSVALSDDFQQPGHLPKHASVFTFSVKSMVYPPLLDQWDELDATVDPRLAELLRSRPIDVPRQARRADRASRPVLAPPESPSQAPSGSPSGSASGSPSGASSGAASTG